MIKCIAIDMDGTLLTAAQKVTEENIAAIKLAQSQGVEVVIATGRSYQEAYFVLAGTGIDCPMICVNGAEVRNIKKEIIAENPLNKTAVKAAIEILQRNDVYFEVYTNNGSYTIDEEKAVSVIVDIVLSANPEMDAKEVETAARIRVTKGLVKKISDYEAIIQDEEHKVYKLLAFSFVEDKLRSAEKELHTVASLAVTTSAKSNLEVTAKDAQKGNALEKYVKESGISLQETMAIGDNHNDVSMFQIVGRAVAMGNASAEIKAQCDAVTLTNEESGVAKAILEVLK